MAITVANTESEVVTRLRGKLVRLSLSVLVNGSNPDLKGPIRRSLGWVGMSPAAPPAVTDADLADVTGWDVEKLFDAATLEALYVCLGNCASVDETVGLNSQSLSQLSAQILAMIKALEERLTKPYGPNVQGGAVGQMAGGVPMPNDTFNVRRSRVNPCTWPYPS